MSQKSGDHLGGYQLIEQLGAGGMGEVWLARDETLGRRVAVKLLPEELTRDPLRVSRFQQEARAASALNHPNVCTIHALAATPDGQHYIAMEHVEGETLRHRLSTQHLPMREAVEIGIQVAAALSATHAAGIIHRDIKPENVMLRPDGFVKVLDFGLAKLAPITPGIAGDNTTLTMLQTDAGTVLGTATYMSPEQARGQEVDVRTDIWSLGVTLYEMVAGRLPFAGPSGTDVLAAILHLDPAPLARFEPSAPLELQRIITKALRKDQKQRYQSSNDLLLDLQALRDQLHSKVRAGSSPIAETEAAAAALPLTVQSDPRRRSVAYAVVAVAAVVGAAVGVSWKLTERTESRASAPAPPVQRNLTRLTFDPGLQTDPAFSPDGRFVAYAADRGGNFDIWVQPVAGADPVQVTKSLAADTQPNWSPDGSTIVFRSERDGGGLYLVPALGGPERRLTDVGAHPSWSADGKDVRFITESFVHGSVRLSAVARDGGAPRPILPEFTSRGSWNWIAPHPDGRFSFFGSSQDLGFGLFTASADGSVIRSVIGKHVPATLSRLLDASWDVYGRRFQWNNQGTALILETQADNGLSNLWRVGVDPGTLEWTSFERLTTGAGADVHANLSPDATRLAFSTLRTSTRLWKFPLDVAGHRLGDGQPLTEEGSEVSYLSVTRGGDSATYNLGRPGSPEASNLWLMDLDSGRSKRLWTNGGAAKLSPNRDTIAYTKTSSDPKVGFAAIAVQKMGDTERVITPWSRSWIAATDWLPDGSAVLVAAGELELWPWPVAGTPAAGPLRTVLRVRDAALHQAKYSPNGRWLSFVVDPHTGRAGVGVTSAEGAPDRKWVPIAPDRAWVDKPRWAPDGRTLHFLASEGASLNLWAVNFDQVRGEPSGQPFPVARFNSPSFRIDPGVSFSEMDVSTRFVFLTMQTAAGNVWMLDTVDK